MKTYFRILNFIKPYWKHLLISIVFTISYAIFNGASVYLTIPLLKTLFNEGEKIETVEKAPEAVNGFVESTQSFVNELISKFNEFVFGGSQTEILLRICILIGVAFLLKNISGYLQAYFLSFVEQNFVKDLRDKAYIHLHNLPMSYFKREQTGELISRVTNDVNVAHSISSVFFNLIREPITIVVFLAIAISISWQLTLFAIVILPFSILVIAGIGRLIRKQSTELQSKMADITTILEETITGVKIVKAFGMEKYEINKFQKETNIYSKIILKMIRVRNAAPPITEFLSVLSGIAIIYYGGHLVLTSHEMAASEFFGFIFAILQLMPPMKEISNINNRIQESSAAADRIFEILDLEPSIVNSDHPAAFSNFNQTIKFKNVSFHYEDSDELVLNNVNLEVNKGQIIALVGSSGAGKTTLVDLIPRFYDPIKGSISIDDKNIKDISIQDLRKLMGIVTQETVLFNESVIKNIAYGLDDYPENKIIEAAKAANAHEFILQLPDGYNSIIGEKGTKLSGGQRQRLSIARALLKNPPIMIFDEATSALDNESELLVQQAIETLMKDRTTFVIAHRLSTIRNADRILVLDKGKIVQAGKHSDLLEDSEGIYRKLYELQFRNP